MSCEIHASASESKCGLYSETSEPGGAFTSCFRPPGYCTATLPQKGQIHSDESDDSARWRVRSNLMCFVVKGGMQGRRAVQSGCHTVLYLVGAEGTRVYLVGAEGADSSAGSAASAAKSSEASSSALRCGCVGACVHAWVGWVGAWVGCARWVPTEVVVRVSRWAGGWVRTPPCYPHCVCVCVRLCAFVCLCVRVHALRAGVRACGCAWCACACARVRA